jgi:hypothetical protein
LIVKWVINCFLHLITCKSTTSYSITDSQTHENWKGPSLDCEKGVRKPKSVAECCWRWGVPCHEPEHPMTTFVSILCEQPASVHYLVCCNNSHLIQWYLCPYNVQG